MSLFVSNIFSQLASVMFDNAMQVITLSETASLALTTNIDMCPIVSN